MSDFKKVSSIPRAIRYHYDYVYYHELKRYGHIHLFQVGDLCCESEFALQPHDNFCYEITYIVSGRGWFSNDGKRYEVEAGDIHLTRPGEIHEGGVDQQDPFRYMYMGFLLDPSLQEGNPYYKIKQFLNTNRELICTDRLNIRNLFISAIKESNSSNDFAQSMLEMLLHQILVITYRNFSTEWEMKYPLEGLDSEAKKAVYATIHFIDEQILEIKDLKEVSDAVGYSFSHLSYLFSRETGGSLRDYFMKMKWKKAVELLRDGNYSITEVARMVHYHTIHTFSRAFRKEFGLSPSQYLQKLNQ